MYLHVGNEMILNEKDIIGVFDPGIFSIGDTVCSEAWKIQFEDMPVFPPEIFARVQPKNSLKIGV